MPFTHSRSPIKIILLKDRFGSSETFDGLGMALVLSEKSLNI